MNTRELPHSLEAEESLLACCILDGRATIAQCRDAGVTRSSFYDQKNGIVFSVLVGLVERNAEIVDVTVLAEELKNSGQLDAVGGFSFVAQVSGRLPTTAQAPYYISRVRELQIQREFVKAARDAAEAAVDCDRDRFQQITADLRAAVDAIASAASPLSAQLKTRRMNPAVTPPEPREIYRVGKIPICTAGNLTCINAEAKAGKSAFAGAMIAAPMALTGADCLTVSAENKHGHALLHFDTEQSAGDWFRLLCRAKRRAGIEEFPPWLVSYHLTGLTAAECRASIELAMTWARRDFGGIFAVFIDGIADLVVDPNDPAECFPFVTRLHALAIEHDTAIINVLHRNPGMEKTRGHLGSQLERKSESNLTMEKDKESGATVVYSLKQRGPSIPQADGPNFRWSDGEGMHVTAETVGEKRQRAKSEKLIELARKVFTDPKECRAYKELNRDIQSTANCGERTADSRISEMHECGIIQRFPPNLYRLAS